MKQKLVTAALCAVFLAWLPASYVSGQTKGVGIEESAEETVTVQAVDVQNRLLTVKESNGSVDTMEVSDRVRNLDQLKPGDKITTQFKVAIATEIKKPGEASLLKETRETGTRSAPGEKPGGTYQRVVKTPITVKSVDLQKNTLTFLDPTNRARTVEVKKPEMQKRLKELKPGTPIEIVYTEALVISVQPAGQASSGN